MSIRFPECPGMFGDYRLLRLLGVGGMGAVYRAHQVSMDRPVALKILPDRLTCEQEFVKRFYREARASAKLAHEYIVQGYAVGEHEGIHYFAMEYIEGEGLDAYIA